MLTINYHESSNRYKLCNKILKVYSMIYKLRHFVPLFTLKANCSKFTLIFNYFQTLRLMRNQKRDIKIRFQYRENALNSSYIRNTSDCLLKYDVIGLFC